MLLKWHVQTSIRSLSVRNTSQSILSSPSRVNPGYNGFVLNGSNPNTIGSGERPRLSPFAALMEVDRLKVKRSLDKFFDSLLFVQKKITAGLLLLMIITVSWQIIGRVIFKISTPWTEDLAKISLIWFTFIGSIGVLYKAQHLTVDLLLVRYGERMRKAVRIFVDVVIAAFTIMLFVFGVILCNNPIIIKGITTGLNVSRLYLYLSLPISMFFSSLVALYDLVLASIDIIKPFPKAIEEGGNAE